MLGTPINRADTFPDRVGAFPVSDGNSDTDRATVDSSLESADLVSADNEPDPDTARHDAVSAAHGACQPARQGCGDDPHVGPRRSVDV